MKHPNKVLMVKPVHFDVEYSINPHMLDATGNLNTINKENALNQWALLKKKFLELNLEVFELEAQEGFPDMVFTANQTFPFLRNECSQFVLSNMNSLERSGEVHFFKKWALEQNIETYELDPHLKFEGMGDALWNYETEEVFGGYGFRTTQETYKKLENLIEKNVCTLKLISEDFYHLDTCLAIANQDTAFVVKEGFDQPSFEKLKDKFKNLVEIPLHEAKQGFAANLCALKGTDLILQKGNEHTKSEALRLGFRVHELETTEFMKSGGSVFCMKQLFW